MGVRILAIGLTFVQTIVLTRVFGIEVFGLLSFALSVSALLILILSLGLDQVLMRDVARLGKAKFFLSQRWQDIWRLILWGMLPLTVVTAILGILILNNTEFGGDYALLLITSFLLLPFILFRKFLEAVSLGTKQAVRSITGSQIIFPTLLILGGCFVWLLQVTPDETSVAIAYSLAVCGSLIASFLLISGSLPSMRNKESQGEITGAKNEDSSRGPRDRALIRSGIHFSLVSMGFVLGQHIDVLLIGALSTPENVALVRIATRVAEMAGLTRAIISLQYKPLLVEAHEKNDIKLLQKHTTSMVKFFFLTGIPIILVLWFFAEEIMSIFGPEFIVGAWPMRIYVAGVLVSLLFGPGSTVLSMTGNESIASRTLAMAIGLHIILNVLFIPLFGPIGCAGAYFLSMIFLAVSSRIMTIKKVGIEPSIFFIYLR